MWPLLLGDAVVAARAKLALPEAGRVADASRKGCGCCHPRFGNGRLMDAAMRRPLAPETLLDDPAYRDCLAAVLAALEPRPAVFSSRQSLQVKAVPYVV